ncbi:MAG: hypothetical protein ABGX24_01735 [Aquificota bacterium]|jgi:TM2 domain-containing membrane protein YozV
MMSIRIFIGVLLLSSLVVTYPTYAKRGGGAIKTIGRAIIKTVPKILKTTKVLKKSKYSPPKEKQLSEKPNKEKENPFPTNKGVSKSKKTDTSKGSTIGSLAIFSGLFYFLFKIFNPQKVRKIIAYPLWLIFGLISGAHRLYLRKSYWWIYPTGLLLMLLLENENSLVGIISFALFGLWLYDALKIPSWVNSLNQKTL